LVVWYGISCNSTTTMLNVYFDPINNDILNLNGNTVGLEIVKTKGEVNFFSFRKQKSAAKKILGSPVGKYGLCGSFSDEEKSSLKKALLG